MARQNITTTTTTTKHQQHYNNNNNNCGDNTSRTLGPVTTSTAPASLHGLCWPPWPLLSGGAAEAWSWHRWGKLR